MRLIEIVDRDGLSYFEAPGSVCLHELVQLHGPPGRPPGRLAARQQRLLARTSNGITVSRYRLQHQLALSAYARIPSAAPASDRSAPHRYPYRRVERAKNLQARHPTSNDRKRLERWLREDALVDDHIPQS
jgi:hypothetical protein